MTQILRPLVRPAGLACRTVVVSLLSGWLTGHSFDDLERRLAARPAADQAAITAATLLALFLLAILAAQAGIVGMLLYGLGVVVLAR
jgi:hypothetical protein